MRQQRPLQLLIIWHCSTCWLLGLAVVSVSTAAPSGQSRPAGPAAATEIVKTDDEIDVMIAAAERLLLPAEEGPSAFPSLFPAGQRAAVASWMTSLNSSGLWPDIDYSNCTQAQDAQCGDNWFAAEHVYVRLLSMAQVFRSPGPLENSTELASKASLALHGWLTAPTSNHNWWWPDIGSAIPLGQAVLLLRDHLDDTVKQAALYHLAIPSHDEGGSTNNGDVCLANTDGANALWECWAASYLHLVDGNSTALAAMFSHVWKQIQVNGGTDSGSSDGHVGVKPDNSFWHHGSQLQMTHYGQDFSTASMYFSAITSQTTSYQMPQRSYDAFARLVLDGQQWSTIFTPHNPPTLPGNGSGSGSVWEASSLSRAITYPNGSRCWPQVPGAWPRQGSGDNCFHPALLKGVGGARAAEFDNFAKQLDGTGGAQQLLGHRTFWLSDYAVHRESVANGTWVSSVKGFDRGLFNGECVNYAGTQSFFLSWVRNHKIEHPFLQCKPFDDYSKTHSGQQTENGESFASQQGANFNYFSGFEYLNVFPLYDWRSIPGTTVELFPGSDELSCSGSLGPKYKGSSRFVGGVDAKSMGLFAFNMTPVHAGNVNTTLRAHKSWFFPGDGSLIACVDELSAGSPIITTLEQAWADTPKAHGTAIEPGQARVRGTSFSNGAFVYTALSAGVALDGSVEHRAANWTVVAREYGDYPSSAGDVFALSFAHGATAGPLCYSVALANRVAPSPAPTIVRSKSATAVLRGKDVTQVVFWESSSVALSTGHKLRASAPCVLIASAIATGRWQVSVADPSRELRSLTLEIERTDTGGKPCMWEVPLPNGTAVGSTAVGSIECASASE